jgi:RNA 2',3'-cyclic 3'-phosphodiesterase
VSGEDSVRAFLALPRDRMWVESARGLLDRLRSSLPRASWTRESSWHLTLKFLGEVRRDALTGFAAAIGQKAIDTVAGELESDGGVVFPPNGPARVLGVGFVDSGALSRVVELARAAELEARRLGVPPENRDFHPHVTFARVRQPWRREEVEEYRRAIAAWRFPPWQARSCVLYESRLTSEGAVHTAVGEWSLAGGPRGVTA